MPERGAQEIFQVAPDGVAAQRDIRVGDRLPEDAISESLVAALSRGSESVVVRQNEDEAWIDTVLPVPEAAAGEAP